MIAIDPRDETEQNINEIKQNESGLDYTITDKQVCPCHPI
jgi:hypothetical protein